MKMELDASEMEQFRERISQLGDDAERTVNEVLHGDGAELVKKDLTVYLPVSKKSKAHAKTSNPWTTKPLNLGLDITTKSKFGYLIFPDEGRGKRNPVEQDFTGKGLKSSQTKLVENLQNKITEKLKEALQ